MSHELDKNLFGIRHEEHETRESREYVRHGTQEHLGQEACEAQGDVGNESTKARQFSQLIF